MQSLFGIECSLEGHIGEISIGRVSVDRNVRSVLNGWLDGVEIAPSVARIEAQCTDLLWQQHDEDDGREHHDRADHEGLHVPVVVWFAATIQTHRSEHCGDKR